MSEKEGGGCGGMWGMLLVGWEGVDMSLLRDIEVLHDGNFLLQEFL